MVNRPLHAARAQALGQVVFLALLFGVAIAQPAHAYLGQQLLEWAASNIIAPLGLIALVVALAGAFFRPDLAKSGVYAALICAALFFIIRQANTIIGNLQSN